ncbi:MAG: hypothetical protein ACE15B_19080 [Bryobacteraceae bacterium]
MLRFLPLTALPLAVLLSGAAVRVRAAAPAANAVEKIPQAEIDKATRVKERHEDALMRLPPVVGAGVGASKRRAGKAAIHLFLGREPTAKERRRLPSKLEGVPVEWRVTGEFRARPEAAPGRPKPE